MYVKGLVVVIFLFFSFAVYANERIEFDPQTGNYIIYYMYSGELRQTVFVPATKFNPVIKSKYKNNRDGSIKYKYMIKNSNKSRQAISLVSIDINSTSAGSIKNPNNWLGNIINSRLGWLYHSSENNDGLAPGKSEKGFEYISMDLPGIGLMRLSGDTPILRFPGYGPSQEISDKIDELADPKNDSLYRVVAVAKIPVPDPFDAAVVLQGIQTHVQELVGMELIESVFASQLDRLLQAAVDAVKQGNLDAARSDIKDTRHLIHNAHTDLDKEEWVGHDKNTAKGKHHLIAKLAAKVLYFDLRYVEKRMKQGK